MQPIEDYFIVALSALEDNTIKHGSLELEAAAFLKPLQFARTYGRVVAVPSRLSKDNRYNLELKEWGFPVPKMGITSDWIQQRQNCGETDIDRSWYSIAGAQPQHKVMADYRWYEGMVEPGDTLYFHYRANQPQNIVHQENGETWIKVRFDQAICAFCRQYGTPVMLANHILAQSVEESWEDITNSFGLITTSAPKVFPNLARLIHISSTDAKALGKVYSGDTIVVQPNSLNFEMEIEGTKYFVMKERELHMKVIGDTCVPLGDRVLIKPDDTENKTATGIIIPDTAIQKQHTATILAVGSKVEEEALKPDVRVLYAKDSGAQLEYKGEKFLVVRESDIATTIQ